MKRRRFIEVIAGGLLAEPLAAEGQQAGKVPRIALVTSQLDLQTAFREGMRSLGWVEGQNITIGVPPIPPVPSSAWMAEVLKLNVDVVVGSGSYIQIFAREAPSTVAVVLAGYSDPVAGGLARSLARPGGNATGLATLSLALDSKRLQLLKEAVPRISRVAYLTGASTLSQEFEAAARALRLALLRVTIDAPEAFAKGFADVTRQRADAVSVGYAPFFWSNRRVIVEFAVKQRLPAVYPFDVYAESGGLMSYGADYKDIYQRAATYVDKILKGAKPGDLPVEQPTKFELVINLKTAKALGLTIPPSVLGRADELIQ